MEEWHRFTLRYRDAIEEMHERYPGFWIELRDLAESRDRRRTTTRGATVREFPRTRDQGTQASGGRTLGQCLFGVAAPEPRNAGTQTETAVTQSQGIQADTPPPVVVAAPRSSSGRGRGLNLLLPASLRRPGLAMGDNYRPSSPSPEPSRAVASLGSEPRRPGAGTVIAARPPTRGSTLCWNCRSADHRYSNCPWPKDRQYCYGCGREGVTLRTCPGCRDEWRDLGPYHPDRGHLGHQ